MTQNENCSGAATPEQQMKMEGFGEASLSMSKYTTALGPISRFLSQGQENAVTARYLENVTGWDNRSIRKAIEAERRHGCPILIDNMNGYFLPCSKDEITKCVRSMRHRAGEIMKTASAIEKGRFYG